MSNGDDTKSNGNFKLRLQGGGNDVPTYDDNGNPNGVALTATLTNGNVAYPGQTVIFRIAMPTYDSALPANQQARLSPADSGSNGAIYTAKTNSQGQATVTVYDGSPDEVMVMATYTLENHNSISPSNLITFIPPKVDNLAATLVPDKITMGSVIQATATVTSKNGMGLPGIPVVMTLPAGSGPFFCDSNGNPQTDGGGEPLTATVVTSDANGNATTYFTSPLWGSGELSVDLEDNDGSIDQQQPEYTFSYDNSIEAVFDDTVAVKHNGTTKTIVNSGADVQVVAVAPADGGGSLLRISGWVQYRTGPAPLGGNPSVILNLSGTRASFVNHDLDRPGQITVACVDRDRGGTSWAGYFTADLASDLPETGHVTVTVDRNVDADGNPFTGAPPAEPAIIAYEFRDAWANVNNTTIQSANGDKGYAIYANGLHQAQVTLSFDLISAEEGRLIPQDACPTVEDLAARVQFLDYVSSAPITRLTSGAPWPGNVTWGFDDIANEYSKKSLGGGATLAVLDVARSVINNGRATLYFYIRHGVATNPEPITLGVMISPTGCYLDATATVQAATAVNFSRQGSALPAPQLIITPVAPPKLKPESLISTCTPYSSARQNDNGPANIAANPEYKDNYYRQFDYEIMPSPEFLDANYITAVVFSISNINTLQSNYCYSSTIHGLYDYRLYLWPSDVLDLPGKNQPDRTGKYSMKSNIDYGAKADPMQVDDAIAVSRYIGFGATCHENHVQTDINLVMADEYGNTYPFYLPADPAPPAYNTRAMEAWNPAIPGVGTRNDINTSSTAADYSVGNATASVNFSKRLPALANPSASASIADLTYQSIAGDTGLQTLTITLSATYDSGSSALVTSPVFNISFTQDSACKRGIIYDSNNYQDLLICAPSSWSSDATVRGVTLRPVWSSGAMLIGVNPTLSTSQTGGSIRYASAPATPGDPISVKAWSGSDPSQVWKVGT
ncbi:hypothetical protein ACERNI_04025 [Camelimonas sp. ID_303_24]